MDGGSLPLEIEVEDVNALRANPAALTLLDCREPEEFALARIAGAQLLPMSEFPTRWAELQVRGSQRVIVYCHHGMRSLHVVHWLRSRGIASSQSMAGGIDAWSRRIDPAVPRY